VAIRLPPSSGPRRSSNPQMSMRRRTKGGAHRTVNDPERRPRYSRARTMVPSVDAPMNWISLRSMTSAVAPRAMARASARDRAPSVEMSCSPVSQTTVGPASAPAPGARARSGTVKYEEPTGTLALSYLKRYEYRSAPGWPFPPPNGVRHSRDRSRSRLRLAGTSSASADRRPPELGPGAGTDRRRSSPRRAALGRDDDRDREPQPEGARYPPRAGADVGAERVPPTAGQEIERLSGHRP
jgi:hypothetical protein